MKITKKNYYSKKANKEYFSVSQYKSFMECEAKAMAEIRGEWIQEKTTALLVGSYVDAYFEGSLDTFKLKNPEIFKKDWTLKADYTQAEQIIERIKSDALFMQFLSGKTQVIKTGLINGTPFKIKMDSYYRGKMIVDLKILRSCERVMGMSPIQYWNYDVQGAVYQYIEGNKLPFYLAIATKEKVTDIAIVELDQEDMNKELELLMKRLPRFIAIKNQEREPVGCQICDYCKSVKKLTHPIKAYELGFSSYDINFINGKF